MIRVLTIELADFVNKTMEVNKEIASEAFEGTGDLLFGTAMCAFNAHFTALLIEKLFGADIDLEEYMKENYEDAEK